MPLAADPSGFTITPSLGYFNADSERSGDFDDTFGSLGLGYRFDSPWQLELVYAQGDLEDSGAELDYSTYRLDGLYHLDIDSQTVTPYLAIGTGYSEFEGAAATSHESSVNAGLGLKFAVNDILNIRTDFRAIREFDDQLLDFASSIGFQFLIGGESEPEPVPEPVVVDSDGDGVPDDVDQCANTPAGVEVDANGCELDSDSDGIVNSKDECPDTELGAKVDAVGCYIILTESRNVRLDVKFANNSSKVDENYLDKIQEVAQFMREHPKTDVVIEGHTDDRGKAGYNLILSEERAKNVAAMLVSRFNVDASRVSSVGYGESKPISDNGTLEGRAENRRVVAIISATVQKRAE